MKKTCKKATGAMLNVAEILPKNTGKSEYFKLNYFKLLLEIYNLK